MVLLMVLALHCVFNLSYRTPHLQPANDALKVAGTPTPAPDRVVQKLVDNGRVRTAEEIRIMAEKSRRRAARHRKQIGIVWDSEDVGGNESPALSPAHVKRTLLVLSRRTPHLKPHQMEEDDQA